MTVFLKDAAKIRQECGGNVFIKVPVTPEGLAAIKTLKSEGYKITANRNLYCISRSFGY